MSLSSDMLKGCKGTEPHFGEYFETEYSDDFDLTKEDRTKCCALGGLIRINNIPMPTSDDDLDGAYYDNKLRELYPDLNKTFLWPINGETVESELFLIIHRLFDDHGWSVRRIVNWLKRNNL